MGKKAQRVRRAMRDFVNEVARHVGLPNDTWTVDVPKRSSERQQAFADLEERYAALLRHRDDLLRERTGLMGDNGVLRAQAREHGRRVSILDGKVTSARDLLTHERETTQSIFRVLREAVAPSLTGDVMPDHAKAYVVKLVGALNAAKESERETSARLMDQVNQWAPVMQTLGAKPHESAMQAAQRVVRERDELAAGERPSRATPASGDATPESSATPANPISFAGADGFIAALRAFIPTVDVRESTSADGSGRCEYAATAHVNGREMTLLMREHARADGYTEHGRPSAARRLVEAGFTLRFLDRTTAMGGFYHERPPS